MSSFANVVVAKCLPVKDEGSAELWHPNVRWVPANRLEAGAARGMKMPASTLNPVAPVLILVVEDQALIHDMMRSALEEAGFVVLVASTGADAIALLEGDQCGPIRAVVTDINLGKGTDGWQIARRARELRPEMPLLYVTGYSANEWAVNGVPQSLFINKPFAPAQIVTAVSQVLNAEPAGVAVPHS